MIRQTIGPPELLNDFDPTYRFREVFPFNSGFFASHRGAVRLDDLKDVVHQLRKLHAKHGLPPLNNSRRGVFYTDQGLINYLVYKSGIALDLLTDIFVWGGRRGSFDVPTGNGDPFRHMFIHWAGCRRPNFTSRNVPAGDVWIRFYYEYYRDRGSRLLFLRDTVRNIWNDAVFRVRNAASRVKRSILRTRG